MNSPSLFHRIETSTRKRPSWLQWDSWMI